MQQVACRNIVAETQQVLFMISVAHPIHHRAVYMGWNGLRILDRIEIRNQRDCDPIVVIDSLITRNHGSYFARFAAAQLHGRLGANVFEINRCVPGGVDGAEEAIRLLHQQGGLGMAARTIERQKRQGHESERSDAEGSHKAFVSWSNRRSHS